MTQEIPKLDLLIKLVAMTGSTHDNEALAAMRKANTLITASGWTWDRLLRGKVTIAADPFSGIAAPPTRDHTTSGMSAGPTAPRPHYNPPPYTPPSRPRPQPPNHISQPNRYSGNCWRCGLFVGVTVGRTFKRGVKWEVACTPCDTYMAQTGRIPSRRAPKATPSVNDLASIFK